MSLFLICMNMIISSYISFFIGMMVVAMVFWFLSGLMLVYLLYRTYNMEVEIFNILWFLLFSFWVVLSFALFL